jgi:hypothetical protein
MMLKISTTIEITLIVTFHHRGVLQPDEVTYSVLMDVSARFTSLSIHQLAALFNHYLVLPPIHSRSSINQMEIKHIVDTVALFLNLISITHQIIHFQYFKISCMYLQVNWQLSIHHAFL